SGKSGKLYTPSLPVVVVREKAVDASLTVTSASTTAAPCASVTVPRTEPLTSWARETGALETSSITKQRRRVVAKAKCQNTPACVFRFEFMRNPSRTICACRLVARAFPNSSPQKNQMQANEKENAS